jgi:hypothetical protein
MSGRPWIHRAGGCGFSLFAFYIREWNNETNKCGHHRYLHGVGTRGLDFLAPVKEKVSRMLGP